LAKTERQIMVVWICAAQKLNGQGGRLPHDERSDQDRAST